MTAPVDNLVRSRYGDDAIEVRADTTEEGILTGHFAVFDTWTEINSWSEGRFMERLVPGAFERAFGDIKQHRVLYDHGHDPSIGSKPIATPRILREDDKGAYYEDEILESTYAQDLLPAARAGQLGASFRFGVDEDEWVTPKKETKRNPEKLRERTIRVAFPVYEHGPTPWGAYPTATTGVRSGTDEFYDHLFNDPLFVSRFTDMVGVNVVERILENAPGDSRASESSNTADGLSLPPSLLLKAQAFLATTA